MTVLFRSLKFMGYKDYAIGNNGTPLSKRKGGPTGGDFVEFKSKTWKVLKAHSNGKDGHLFVYLFNNKGQKKYYIHTLVLLAFKGKPKPGQEGRHYPDRDPTNNSVNNLRWGSKSKNQGHDRIKQGTDNRGESHGMSKLTNKIARKILKLLKRGWSQKELSSIYHVHRNTIYRLNKGESFKNVKR